MNWEAVSASGEIIGAGAVIITLIYLAIQIRQGINTVQGATEVELSKQFADYHARIAGSPELRSTWDKAIAGENLSDDERATYIWLIAQLFFMLEGFFRQYKRKLLDEESWQPLEAMLLGFLQKDLVAAWWGERAAPISPAFRDHIDNALHRGEHHDVRPARVIGKAH
ncbi:MAG: hypothetical protein ACR2RD_15410 [Woeseiaceae bacterium]